MGLHARSRKQSSVISKKKPKTLEEKQEIPFKISFGTKGEASKTVDLPHHQQSESSQEEIPDNNKNLVKSAVANAVLDKRIGEPEKSREPLPNLSRAQEPGEASTPSEFPKAKFDAGNNVAQGLDTSEGRGQQVIQIKASGETLQDYSLSSLPPQLAYAVQQYRALNEDEFRLMNIKANLKNIWFLRILFLGAVEVMAILLFTYSFIFLGTFLHFANTTSYFPWAWKINYARSDPVWNEFTVAIVISLFALVASMAIQFFIFEKKLMSRRILF
jgi:hypothetical protein